MARRRQADGRALERTKSAGRASGRAGCPDNIVDFPAPSTDSVPLPAPPAPLGGFIFFLIWLLRLSILGAGLGAIIGTVLAIVRPQQHFLVEATPVAPALTAPTAGSPADSPLALQPTHKLLPLREQFATLAAARPQLTPGAYVIDLNTGEYLNLRGEERFSAASTIAVPILVALFQAVEAEAVALDEGLAMRPDLIDRIDAGSNASPDRPPNRQYSVLEAAEQAIITGDNAAANLLIDRLGGIAALNARFREWGLEHTTIRNLLPDLSGTNTTSPQDLAKLVAMVERGHLVGPQSRGRILAIMRQTQTQAFLPPELAAGATIAYKTGDIGSMVGDIGLIDMPSGKRYIAAVLVERPHNDPHARELIRAYARAAHRYFASILPKTDGFTTLTSEETATVPVE